MDNTFTKYEKDHVTFDVVIDNLFLNLSLPEDLEKSRRALLSLVNRFEDGQWTIKRLHSFLWDNIKETALTQEEKQALIQEEGTLLEKSAKNLRLLNDDADNDGGEIGEILLYGLMKKYYDALPVVPKIFYKQNTKDYAKGADSVHIVLDKDSNYTLWLGESKFYNSLESSRLDKIVGSVKDLLNSEKLKKEFSIVTSLKELDYCILDEALREKIKKDLKDGLSLDDVKKQLHVPILLLHECKITAGTTSLSKEYIDSISKAHIEIAQKYMKKQDAKLKDEIWGYNDISFHIILFPVPEKSKILEIFFKRANNLKE